MKDGLSRRFSSSMISRGSSFLSEYQQVPFLKSEVNWTPSCGRIKIGIELDLFFLFFMTIIAFSLTSIHGEGYAGWRILLGRKHVTDTIWGLAWGKTSPVYTVIKQPETVRSEIIEIKIVKSETKDNNGLFTFYTKNCKSYLIKLNSVSDILTKGINCP